MTALPAAAQLRARCESGAEPAGRVVGLDGLVTVTDPSGDESLLAVGSAVCFGDRIETGERSNVELRFDGADTTTGASSNTLILIPSPDEDYDLTVMQGLIRFVSSVRGFFTIRTPVVNAGIEGTEAMVVVDGPADDTLVLVREGEVMATDRRSPGVRLSLDGGEAAYASRAAALVVATPENVPEKFRSFLLDPEGAADWAVYYPPVLLGAGVEAPVVREAAERLSAGQPDAADAMLAGAALAPRDRAAALAVRAVAAVFRNDTDAGLALADAAVAADEGLGAAHVARSYALQADGRLEAARDAAARAVEASPQDAYAWARLAELELTIGDYRGARRAVERSLALQETALGRAVEGFLELARARVDRGEEAFRRAIAIDSNDPLPRLGLGLAKVRRGDLAEGRAEMETAVALDPRRASLRTWLGRVYFEEHLAGKAAAQFEIAKEEDPDDPTPYYFSAFERFAANDPVEALRQAERAAELGEQRATVRGETGLAEDRAVRGSSIARIYDLLGFEQLAILTAADAVEEEPANPEGHFFLSDAFLGRTGFEIAQSSELLLGQMLAPPNRGLVQPRLAEADLGLLQTTGPAQPTLAEFSPLVIGNGVSFGASGRFGTQETRALETSAAALDGPVSLAYGQSLLRTDGFLDNNFVEHEIYSVEGRLQLAPSLFLFSELRHRDTEEGDRFIDFGNEIEPNLRNEFNRDSARAGVHWEPAPGHDLIGLATLVDFDSRLNDCTDLSEEIEADQNGYDVQGRYFGRFGDTQITAGGSMVRLDAKTRVLVEGDFGFFGPDPCAPFFVLVDEEIRDTLEHEGGFFYARSEVLDGIDATLGFSYDDFDRENYSADGFNPKAGLEVGLADGIGLRAAYAETVKRPLVLNQTVEPTMIAGFNQFFDDVNGAETRMAGVGIDTRPSSDLWVGAEAVKRWIDSPVLELLGGGVDIEETSETTLSGYAHAILSDEWTLAAEIRHERFRLENDIETDLPDEIDTTAVPLRLGWFDDSGLFASGEATYLAQSFTQDPGGPERDDDGVLFGASVGFRLPNGRGVIALEGRNLLDEDLDIRDQTFNSVRNQGLLFSRDRAVLLTGTFAFGQ